MNKQTIRHMKRGMDILRRQGISAFINKVKVKLAERRAPFAVQTNEQVITYSELDGTAV